MNIKNGIKLLISTLLFSVIIAIPFSCGSSGTTGEGIEIAVNYSMKNIKPFENSKYTVSYEILPLQLPQHENIKIFLNNIEVFENYIIISTLRGPLMIFDKTGRFINKIEEGDGVDQLSGLLDFMINREENKIEVMDTKKVIEFDMTGTWIKSNDNEGTYAVEYGISGDKRVFLRQKNSMSNYSFLIQPQAQDFEWKTGQTKVNSINPKHFHTYKNSLYFTGYSNKVYKLSAQDTIPQVFAYVKNMNTDNTVKDIDKDRYEALCDQKSQFTYINNFYIYNDNLFGFSLLIGSEGFKILYDKETNNYYSHPLTNVPYSQNNRWVEEGTEYYLFPSNKFDEETAEKIKGIAPDLFKAMENAPQDYKMWVIKASYSKKE